MAGIFFSTVVSRLETSSRLRESVRSDVFRVVGMVK